MRPSIWTQMGALLGAESPCEALEALAREGWDCFEISTEHLQSIQDAPDRDAAVEETKKELAGLNAEAPQAHGYLQANIAHPERKRREGDMERLLGNLRTAAALGVKTVVIHPGRGEGYSTGRERERIIDLNLERFRILGDLAGELGIRIGIENLMDSAGVTGSRKFGASPHELMELLERLNHPALGICLDTSHAHAQRLDLPVVIREFGARIICTHISDNDGTGDGHRIPGNSRDGINWPEVMTALRDIGYDGLLNLEIPGERSQVPEMVRRKVRFAREVTDWLISQA